MTNTYFWELSQLRQSRKDAEDRQVGVNLPVDFSPDANTERNRVKKSCASCEPQVTGSKGIPVSTNLVLPAEQ